MLHFLTELKILLHANENPFNNCRKAGISLFHGQYYPLVLLNILNVAHLIPYKKCLFSGFMTWMSHTFCV